MKHFYLIFSIITFVLCGCGTDQGESKTYVYTVENDSGHDLLITSYIDDDNSNGKVFSLLNGEATTKTYEDKQPPSYYFFTDFFGYENRRSESIKIVYGDNLKVQLFLSGNCNQEKNPLNTCKYSGTNQVFTFTQQDYENAQPCDGNCD